MRISNPKTTSAILLSCVPYCCLEHPTIALGTHPTIVLCTLLLSCVLYYCLVYPIIALCSLLLSCVPYYCLLYPIIVLFTKSMVLN